MKFEFVSIKNHLLDSLVMSHLLDSLVMNLLDSLLRIYVLI